MSGIGFQRAFEFIIAEFTISLPSPQIDALPCKKVIFSFQQVSEGLVHSPLHQSLFL